jgi:hypothetical protein
MHASSVATTVITHTTYHGNHHKGGRGGEGSIELAMTAVYFASGINRAGVGVI